MTTRRFTHPGRTRATTCAAVLGLALLASPALAGASSAATRRTASAGPVATAATGPAMTSTHRAVSTVHLPAGFRPEGIASGPNRTYYIGSLADGRIWTGSLNPRSADGHQLTPGVPGRSLRGMELDRRSGLLWAAGQDGETGILLGVDIATGAIAHRIVVPGAVFLNDLVVEPNAVWVTDSQLDRLTRVALDCHSGSPTGAVDAVALGGSWPQAPAGAVRANGIDTLWDGSLLLDHSSVGGLWQVDPHTGTARQIPVRRGPGITGGDGLERRGHTLFVVRGNDAGRVEKLKLHHNRRGWTATWRSSMGAPGLQVPSTATLVHHVLWTVDARFGIEEPDTADYSIVPLTH